MVFSMSFSMVFSMSFFIFIFYFPLILHNFINTSWKPGEFLGQGSYASVIMGFNEETGEIMAVKQVRLHEASKISNVFLL